MQALQSMTSGGRTTHLDRTGLYKEEHSCNSTSAVHVGVKVHSNTRSRHAFGVLSLNRGAWSTCHPLTTGCHLEGSARWPDQSAAAQHTQSVLDSVGACTHFPSTTWRAACNSCRAAGTHLEVLCDAVLVGRYRVVPHINIGRRHRLHHSHVACQVESRILNESLFTEHMATTVIVTNLKEILEHAGAAVRVVWRQLALLDAIQRVLASWVFLQ